MDDSKQILMTRSRALAMLVRERNQIRDLRQNARISLNDENGELGELNRLIADVRAGRVDRFPQRGVLDTKNIIVCMD
ncbi:hypothetical protein [Paraburkholderia fungorum]|uniref:Uncharacterized protein n=1 Tax=Paraburkholderia fungorum TaxID=134537 RepID=A0A420FJ45_9BURK|nr:hypothetical protein [Paraburkholderia fungorum]RKF32944.1 hypothetical protein BCY88_38685 [Paraburkholderia fungorum]